jgi:hypothetical protein
VCQNPLKFQPSQCLPCNARKSLSRLVENICLLNGAGRRAKDQIVGFKQLDSMVMSAFTSLLASGSSDKSTPQKLVCRSKDSTPACISFGATCRVHVIRNFAFFDPRCKLMIIPARKGIRRAPRPCLRDVNRMRQASNFIDRNLDWQHHFSARRVAFVQH